MILKVVNIVLIVFVVFNLSTNAIAQRAKSHRVNKPVRILKDKPTVYITFEHFGQREPSHTDESDKGVWLRLHNNTHWSLVLQAQGAGSSSFSKGTEEEVGMFYGVEEMRISPYRTSSIDYDSSPSRSTPPLSDEQIKANLEATKYLRCKVPPSHFCTACSVIHLPPGKSFLFSLPREALCGNLKAYISYQYDWEDDWGFGSEPEHRVYFYGSQLPSETNKK